MNKSQRQKDQFQDQAPEGLPFHPGISPRKVMEVSNIVPWVSGTRRPPPRRLCAGFCVEMINNNIINTVFR